MTRFSAFSTQTIERVRQYHGIVELISQYVTLKKRGKNHIGLCPFHSEKSPSFTVSAEKRLWHCFGCQESGDTISFLQKIDNLTFKEAIEHIAHTAGIEIEYVESNSSYDSQFDKKVEGLRQALLLSREYFKKKLTESSDCLSYLKKRGLSDTMMSDFHIGLAPASNELLTHLKTNGVSETHLLDAGMGARSEKGFTYAKFRERIMFPISDHLGRLVGFSGRVLPTADHPAKYINSEETIIFNKRKVLYGLDRAKQAIHKSGYIIVTEGFFDAIALVQKGFPQTVASMGTALTDQHAKLIKRFTSNVILALDNDSAGQAAVQKSIQLFIPLNMDIRVLKYDQKDPADFILNNKPEVIQTCIQQSEPGIEYLFRSFKNEAKTLDVKGISDIISKLVPFLKTIQDPIVLRHYVSQFSRELDIDESLVMAKIKNTRYNLKKNIPNQLNKIDRRLKAWEMLIYFMANDLAVKESILEHLDTSLINEEPLKQLLSDILPIPLTGNDLVGAVPERSKNHLIELQLKIASKYEAPNTDTWMHYIQTLNAFQTKKKIDILKQQLEKAESDGDDALAESLLTELQLIMKQTKEG